MEIDLDNLVFSGLDEAEERNAERLEEADKKRRRSLPMTIAATPAKSDCQTGQQAGFFAPPACSGRQEAFQRIQQRLRRLRQRHMPGMDRADALLNRRIAERDADGPQGGHLRFTQRRHRAAPRPLATILPTVTSW